MERCAVRGAERVAGRVSAHLQLRKARPQVAAEQPRPGAGRDQHGLRRDTAAFGDDRGHPAGHAFDAAYGAALHEDGPGLARQGGDALHRELRLGHAVGGAVHGTRPVAARIGQVGQGRAAVELARIDSVRPGVVDPGLVAGGVRFGLLQIQHARPAKTDIDADWISPHSWLARIASGTSGKSRVSVRTQPQLRDDCSQASVAFSNRATRMPAWARAYAVLTPITPPPMMATPTEEGSGAAALEDRACGFAGREGGRACVEGG